MASYYDGRARGWADGRELTGTGAIDANSDLNDLDRRSILQADARGGSISLGLQHVLAQCAGRLQRRTRERVYAVAGGCGALYACIRSVLSRSGARGDVIFMSCTCAVAGANVSSRAAVAGQGGSDAYGTW